MKKTPISFLSGSTLLLAFTFSFVIFFVHSPLVGAHATSTIASTTQIQWPHTIKEVALTFDDGPYGTSTQEVLNILQNENVRATFFILGKNTEKYPALAREIVKRGNVVGNHTYDHTKNLTTMTHSQVQSELSKTEAIIASTTGVHATLFRAPYGKLTRKLRSVIQSEGYIIVPWNVDPKDWDYTHSSSTAIENHIFSHLNNRMIILLHDGRDTHVGYPRDNMTEALPFIIQGLKQRGYAFVTVDKLSAL